MKCLYAILLFLAAAQSRAADLRHDLYVCVSQSKPFVIGTKVQQLNGLYRMDGRITPTHVGFNHPRIDAMAADPRDPKRIYAAGLNGVLRSLDGGGTWRIVTGWDMTEGKDIAVDPHEPENVYVGLPDGIAVSRDGGQTWVRANAGIRRAYTQTICVDRTRAGRVLAGTELGIYLSDDGAATWRRVFPTTKTVNNLRQSPHDPAVFLAATQAEGAVLSRDGGEHWETLPGTQRGQTLHNVDFDAADPQRLYLAGWGCGILASEDGGRTWSRRSETLPNADIWRMSADPDLPGRLYASPHGEPIFISDDYGRTWKARWFTAATVWDFVFVPRS